MKNITIIAIENNVTRTFVAAEDETLRSVLEHEDVLNFFDAEAETIRSHFDTYNGTDMSNEAVASALLNAVVNDGDVIEIDLAGSEEAGEDNDAQGGTCVVATSGGMQETEVTITEGMTVRDAVYSEAVRTRSGMTDAQLSASNFTINGETIAAANLGSRQVRNGDRIVLSPHAACTKGCRR
jgi:putative ubiquitin-RnfH superfamily antitoxin RatB of RatAB toxin-antitoxin module